MSNKARQFVLYFAATLILCSMCLATDTKVNIGAFQRDEPGAYYTNIGADQRDNPQTTPSQLIIIGGEE
jgi:hypothetical protein